MLRTIVVRNELLRETFKKVIRINTARALSVECTRRRHRNKQPTILKSTDKLQWKYNAVRSFSNLPPHTRVTLPALSPTMETGKIVSWEKKEGDKLNDGDLLCEIETDKATMGFETPEDGYLAKIIVPAGTQGVPIGKLVCIIVADQASVAAFKNFQDDGAGAAPAAAAAAPAAPAPAAPAPAAPAPAAPAPAAPAPVAAFSGPPHTRVTLPALSPTMETGKIVSWEKKEGDKLSDGDLLCEIETDKATMGFETPEEGYLAKIIVPAGTKGVPIGKLVCIIVADQASVAAFKNFQDDGAGAAPAARPAAAAAAPRPSAAAPSVPSSGGAPGGRVYASPMAKRLAEQRQIRLQGKGTGMYDSITSRDVPAAGTVMAGAPAAKAAARGASPAKPAAGAAYIDIPVSGMRATIAKRLTESKHTSPHVYISTECTIDKLMATRASFNRALEKEKVKLSLNDFIIKCMALASKKVPEVNAQWMGSNIRQFSAVDVSVAVATPTGLITPIVFNADSMGLVDISKKVKELAEKARKNKLKPQEFQGGTITISNLGMFGVTAFSAVINPPQAAILAVGTGIKKLVLDNKTDEGFRETQVINATICCDHRVIDGAVAAMWLDAFRKMMEDPVKMIL